MDPRTTEDCLFLDVDVPKNIYDNAGNGKGAPVLVWIYGGGYTMGSKSDSGNPAGLLKRSGNKGGSGVIVSHFIMTTNGARMLNILEVRSHELPAGRLWFPLRTYIPSGRNFQCSITRSTVCSPMDPEAHRQIRRRSQQSHHLRRKRWRRFDHAPDHRVRQ